MPEARPLTGDERDELRDAAAAVALDDLDALQELVDAVRSGEAPCDEELVFHLGAWYGEQVRRATGWKWTSLSFGEGLEGVALAPRDGSVALLPLELVGEVLEGRSDDVLVSIARRLIRGERPSGEPGSYALVG